MCKQNVVLNVTFTACCRGKGDYFRLGHGTDVHVRKPQVVEGLRGKKIVHVAVGALHCLAVTDTGQVCCASSSFPPSFLDAERNTLFRKDSITVLVLIKGNKNFLLYLFAFTSPT